ncbi:MAG: hypothetical protein ACR2QG_12545 [Gammaproteobacteria bacterium]
MSVNLQANPPGIWVYVMALVPPVLLSVVAEFQPFVDSSELFRDTLAVAQTAADNGECCRAYYGLISTLGGLVWIGSAFITLFVAVSLFNRPSTSGATQFMVWATALTLALVLDDMFQLHEYIYPYVIGIPQKVVMLIYGVLVAAYLYKFQRHIFAVGPGLLIISLFTFMVSAVADMFVSADLAWHRLVEDGSKLVGIFSWTAFHWWAAFSLIERSSQPD